MAKGREEKHAPAGREVVDITDAAVSGGARSSGSRSSAAAAREAAVGSRERTAGDRERAVGIRERSTQRREAAVEARERAADKRDELADQRDVAAVTRDVAAQGRDVDASARDEAARVEEVDREPAKVHPATKVRATAALDRTRSAADRGASAEDRRHSGADRVAAADDRDAAADDRATAILDDLTGVLRRGPGIYELDREIVRARRSGQPFTLGFIDVIGLKAVNDTRGHPAGDEMLQSVAAAVLAHVRPYDPVLRYGGDEFVCALSGTSVAEARTRLEAVNVTLASQQPSASVTIGLADLQPDDTLESLIQRADEDLLQQRHAAAPTD